MLACRPLFNVADVETSLGFWRDGLGFEETQRFEMHGRLMFAQLQSGEAVVMLNGRGGDPAARRARAHYTEAVFYFAVDDVHALHRELTTRGLSPTEPESQEYGIDEVYLRDPDGYELCFTSPTR
jgi:uncharacterized glyoxalase superfamily protein PhnB